MKQFMSIYLAVVVMTILGCAGTVKYDNAFTQANASSNSVKIKVRRSGSWVGGIRTAGIQDGTTKIGLLGPSGELAWSRKPGYVAIITSEQGIVPKHVIIFPVEAGKTYSLVAKLIGGWGFYSKPENFGKELIAYEEKEESEKFGLSDYWKEKLASLSSQYELSEAMKAMEDKDRNVRRTAVKKLVDQTVLAKFAVQDEDSEVRRSAVGKITDQALLAKIYMDDKDSGVRQAAVKNITDQALLEKIYAEDKAQIDALLKLTDKDQVTSILKTEKNSRVITAVLPTLDIASSRAVFSTLDIDTSRAVSSNLKPELREKVTGKCLGYEVGVTQFSQFQTDMNSSYCNAQYLGNETYGDVILEIFKVYCNKDTHGCIMKFEKNKTLYKNECLGY